MVKRKKLLKFATEMEKVLDEKAEKYGGTWKIIPISELKGKLDEQVKDIPLNIKEAKRTLVHVANYCFFLLNRLEE